MTNQQPDKFFREKLADYHKPAPVGAWNKIESSLKKNEPRFAWWKVAASLLLLSTIAYVLWLQTSAPDTQAISQTQSEIESPKAKSTVPKIDSSEPQNTDELLGEQTPIAPGKKDKKSSDKNQSNKKVKRVITHKKNSPEVVSTVPPSIEESIQTVAIPSPENVSGQVVPTDRPIKRSSSIKMTISVEETDKYLDKNALAEATSKERKSSTFKKLLKKANELTTNQDPFGDLRVKKNEILALEFKNDKRGQNK